MSACLCHSMHVEGREQLEGVESFCHLGCKGQLQALRLGSKQLLGRGASLHTFQTWVGWKPERGVSKVVVKEEIGCWG